MGPCHKSEKFFHSCQDKKALHMKSRRSSFINTLCENYFPWTFFFPHNESLEVTVNSSSAVSHGLNIYIFLQRVFDLWPQALLVCGAPGEQSTKVCCASLTGTCGMRWGDGGGWMRGVASLTHDSVFMCARAAVHRLLWAPVQISSQVCCFILKLCPEAVGG